jgi:long-chain fatty acid transport protein
MHSLSLLPSRCRTLLVLLAALLVTPLVSAQQGILLTGAGAVNRSVAGVSTAMPLDASGALYWNPASAVGLTSSEMEFGAELLYPQTKLSSTLPADAFGFGFPPQEMSGSTKGEDGVFPLPSFSIVYQVPDAPLMLGLGVFPAGGFGVNYPADPSNPILSPKPPLGFGVGSIYSRFELLEIAPSVAYRVTDRLSVSFSPILDVAELELDPGIVAAPFNDNGITTYPNLTHSRYAFGGGFQLGTYYDMENGWRFGAALKSPQWLEPFRYNSDTAAGQPLNERFHIDFPMVASAGVSYTGFDRWVLGCDLRYVDYANTTGFRADGYDADGALRGLGWRSTFGVAVGGQYRISDNWSLRGGYSWNQNPIPSAELSANLAATTIEQHTVSVGVSYELADNVSLSLAYLHAFSPPLTGPLTTAAGTVPGASVRSDLAVDSVIAGVVVKFGGAK